MKKLAIVIICIILLTGIVNVNQTKSLNIIKTSIFSKNYFRLQLLTNEYLDSENPRSIVFITDPFGTIEEPSSLTAKLISKQTNEEIDLTITRISKILPIYEIKIPQGLIGEYDLQVNAKYKGIELNTLKEIKLENFKLLAETLQKYLLLKNITLNFDFNIDEFTKPIFEKIQNFTKYIYNIITDISVLPDLFFDYTYSAIIYNETTNEFTNEITNEILNLNSSAQFLYIDSLTDLELFYRNIDNYKGWIFFIQTPLNVPNITFALQLIFAAAKAHILIVFVGTDFTIQTTSDNYLFDFFMNLTHKISITYQEYAVESEDILSRISETFGYSIPSLTIIKDYGVNKFLGIRSLMGTPKYSLMGYIPFVTRIGFVSKNLTRYLILNGYKPFEYLATGKTHDALIYSRTIYYLMKSMLEKGHDILENIFNMSIQELTNTIENYNSVLSNIYLQYNTSKIASLSSFSQVLVENQSVIFTKFTGEDLISSIRTLLKFAYQSNYDERSKTLIQDCIKKYTIYIGINVKNIITRLAILSEEYKNSPSSVLANEIRETLSDLNILLSKNSIYYDKIIVPASPILKASITLGSLKDSINNLFSSIKNTIDSSIIQSAYTSYSNFKESVSQIQNTLNNLASSVSSSISQLTSDFSDVSDVFKEVIDNLPSLVSDKSSWNKFKEYIDNILKPVLDLIERLSKTINDLVSQIENKFNEVYNILQTTLRNLESKWEDFIQNINNVFSNVVNEINNIFATMSRVFSSFGQDLVSFFSNLGQNVIEFFDWMGKAFSYSIALPVTALVKFFDSQITTLMKDVFQPILDIFTRVSDIISDLFNKMLDLINYIVKIIHSILNFIKKIKDALQTVISAVISLFERVFEDFIGNVTSVSNLLTNITDLIQTGSLFTNINLGVLYEILQKARELTIFTQYSGEERYFYKAAELLAIVKHLWSGHTFLVSKTGSLFIATDYEVDLNSFDRVQYLFAGSYYIYYTKSNLTYSSDLFTYSEQKEEIYYTSDVVIKYPSEINVFEPLHLELTTTSPVNVTINYYSITKYSVQYEVNNTKEITLPFSIIPGSYSLEILINLPDGTLKIVRFNIVVSPWIYYEILTGCVLFLVIYIVYKMSRRLKRLVSPENIF